MKKKTVFRVGDIVTVLTPEVFIRCGYPLTKENALTMFDHKPIDEALSSIGIGDDNPAFTSIMDRVAYAWLCENNFGGRDRKIFTETRPEIAGRKYRVVSKKVVKTGRYSPASGGYDYYYGGYDYESAYLSDEKTHVILRLCPIALALDQTLPIFITDDNLFWIEETNVGHYQEKGLEPKDITEAKKKIEGSI